MGKADAGAEGQTDCGCDGGACDVPDGGRFPFQQSVSPGPQPAVSQVGASEDSLAASTLRYNKPGRCCGIWESRLVSDLDE